MKLLKVSYKNFFASGKVPVVIDFTQFRKTLIVGENGQGKSTVLDSVCFGFFGQTYKEVNKPTIVNSINKKNCLVEIEFEQRGVKYLVKRGIKPNLFEIYKEGTLINQSATVREYQQMLEKEILQINFSTFKQVAIVGKSGFTPFMKLKPDQRRLIIEDILDLNIFSNMNEVLKEKIKEVKEQYQENDKLITSLKADLRSVQNNYNFVISKQTEQVKKESEDKQRKLDEIESNKSNLIKLDSAIQELDARVINQDKIREVFNKINEERITLDRERKSVENRVSFYKINSNCPTCKQEIDDGFKGKLISEADEECSHISEKLEKKQELFEKTNAALDKIEKVLQKKSDILNKKNSILNLISHIQNELNSSVSVDYSKEIDTLYNDMVSSEKEINKAETEKEKILLERDEYALLVGMLKDDGIKATAISTFVPIINSHINKYLDMMNFYVQFEIDENFNEVIKSRYRDEFSYDNFSEGEKARIDLALLFSWRAVAKERSSTDLNFIFLDEVHSGSLDSTGEDDLMKILDSFLDTNITVITHSNNVKENNTFERVLTFKKVNNFSTFTEEVIV